MCIVSSETYEKHGSFEPPNCYPNTLSTSPDIWAGSCRTGGGGDGAGRAVAGPGTLAPLSSLAQCGSASVRGNMSPHPPPGPGTVSTEVTVTTQ